MKQSEILKAYRQMDTDGFPMWEIPEHETVGYRTSRMHIAPGERAVIDSGVVKSIECDGVNRDDEVTITLTDGRVWYVFVWEYAAALADFERTRGLRRGSAVELVNWSAGTIFRLA